MFCTDDDFAAPSRNFDPPGKRHAHVKFMQTDATLSRFEEVKNADCLTRPATLASPQRAARPWQGAQETVATDNKPFYDPVCYLCPGNTRAQGGDAVNPAYTGTYVFETILPPFCPRIVRQLAVAAQQIQSHIAFHSDFTFV